jgi:hypothetical protein
MHLSVPPCKDSRTPPHILDSDILVICRLNFSVIVSLLRIRIVKISAFQASVTVQVTLSVQLKSLPELQCRLTNNLEVPYLGLS